MRGGGNSLGQGVDQISTNESSFSIQYAAEIDNGSPMNRELVMALF
jgi:hypothetical protein